VKTGVPDLLRFAVLLQTDGLPFEAEMTFKGSAKQFGVKVGAKKVVSVGREYLWFRRGGGALVEGSEDADSDGFREWVKEKTRNGWAEAVDYDV